MSFLSIKTCLEQLIPLLWHLDPNEGITGTPISFNFSQDPQLEAFRSVFTSQDPPLERRYLIPLNNSTFILPFPEEFPPHQTITFRVDVDVPNSHPEPDPQEFVWIDSNYWALMSNTLSFEPFLADSFESPHEPEQELPWPPDPEQQDRLTFGLSLMGWNQALRKLVC